jgi:predicted RNase H-like HicB family nuclease
MAVTPSRARMSWVQAHAGKGDYSCLSFLSGAVQASASLTSIRTFAYSYCMKNKHAIHIKGQGMKTYVFRVVIEPDEDRYYAEVPALPDCHSWGYTYEEALKNIKQAAELCLETMTEDGEPIPEEDSQTLRTAPITLGLVV